MNLAHNAWMKSLTRRTAIALASKSKGDRGLARLRSKRPTLVEPLENRCMLSGVLGTAAAYAVLGASTVSNTGATAIVGNVGVSPGSAITGFPPGIISGGALEANNASAVQAHADLATAYGAIAGEASPPANDLTGTNLAGLTLLPGVYHFSTSAALNGTLILNAQGNPNARFDFQIGTTLITGSNSAVEIINGGLADNVYFQVGSSATLGTNTAFDGNILADQSITLTTGASMLQGRALALVGGVTMDTNQVSATEADISVTNTTSAAALFAGNNISYTITVANSGPNAAQSVALSDAVPAGTTFVSDVQTSGPSFTLTNPAVGGTGTINGTISSLALGASATFTVVALVPPSTVSGTSITDTSSVTTTTVDPNLTNNSQTVSKSVQTSADISLTNTSAPATVVAGNTISYTITVDNTGPSDAQTLALSDVVPADTTFVSDAQTSGPAFTLTSPAAGGTGTINGTISTLASGASATFTVVALVPPGTPSGTTIVNAPDVTTATADPNVANNSQTVTKSVLTNADISLTNTSAAATVVAGDDITYTITVANNGPSDAQTVALSDPLPANTTFVSDTQTSGPVFTLNNPSVGGMGTISDTIGTLASGASATFSVVALVSSAAPGGTSIVNTANVTSATTDSILANNTQTVTTAVVVAPAITSAAGTVFTAGSPGSFTISTTGFPTTTLTSSTLPAGLTFVDNLNGTATLSGTPAINTSGIYSLTFTATNGVSPDATQAFTLTVNPLPGTPALTNLNISAPANNVDPGRTLQFIAAGTDASGASVALGLVTWSLDSGSTGSVDQNGLFTAGNVGGAGGTAIVRATSGGQTATESVTVNTILPGMQTTHVSSVQTLGDARSVTGLVVTFNGPVDPTTAQDVRGYRILRESTVNSKQNFWQRLFNRDAGTQTEYTPYKIASAVLDLQTNSVTLTLASPMAVKNGVRVLEVMGTGAHAVLDANGKSIDGDDNGTAGGNYVDRFKMSVAKSVTYQTTTGETVKLSLSGPGEILTLLPSGTKTPLIDLVNTDSATSILTGEIRKGHNSVAYATLDELNGTANADIQLGDEFHVNVNNGTAAV